MNEWRWDGFLFEAVIWIPRVGMTSLCSVVNIQSDTCACFGTDLVYIFVSSP